MLLNRAEHRELKKRNKKVNEPQLVDGNTRPLLPPEVQKGQHRGRRAGTWGATKKTPFRIIKPSTAALGMISVNNQACFNLAFTGSNLEATWKLTRSLPW